MSLLTVIAILCTVCRYTDSSSWTTTTKCAAWSPSQTSSTTSSWDQEVGSYSTLIIVRFCFVSINAMYNRCTYKTSKDKMSKGKTSNIKTSTTTKRRHYKTSTLKKGRITKRYIQLSLGATFPTVMTASLTYDLKETKKAFIALIMWFAVVLFVLLFFYYWIANVRTNQIPISVECRVFFSFNIFLIQ
jgi:hypothetical protein